MPSLKQLNEAVMAYIAENPGDLITVVVDATFGHRIDSKEIADFDAAVENNEIVAPPAGAIGRGDAFVLIIANKVKATILSNDSFQEFHGQYDWLFDEDRLIGGKPVPNVGWVFVPRVPVRGPLSRRVVRDSRRKSSDGGSPSQPGRQKASKEASRPMPVPTKPPPAPARGRSKAHNVPDVVVSVPASAAPVDAGRPSGHHLNDHLSFFGFLEQHPVGSTVSAIVESYSSHGAYVKISDVSGYVPLRLMSDPPPRSAREEMAMGETVTLVVAGFNPGRRGIDLGLPAMVAPVTQAPAQSRKRATKKATVTSPTIDRAPPPTPTKPTKPANDMTATKPVKPVKPTKPTKTAEAPTRATPTKATAATKVVAPTKPSKTKPSKPEPTAPAPRTTTSRKAVPAPAIVEPAVVVAAPKSPKSKVPAKSKEAAVSPKPSPPRSSTPRKEVTAPVSPPEKTPPKSRSRRRPAAS